MSAFTPNPSQKRVLECRDSLCVIAGAGSGKTGTLVAAVLERLRESQGGEKPFSVQNLLALTFTEKAAAELRQRLGLAFLEKARTEAEAAQFWRREAARLDRADIGTIHGYALKLVRENALSLGLPAALSIENGNLFLGRDLENILTDWLDEGEPDLLRLLELMPIARLSDILAACVIPFNSWGLGSLSAETDAPEPGEREINAFRETVRNALELVENGDLNKTKPYYEKVRGAMLGLTDDLAKPLESGQLGARLSRWQSLIKESGDWFSKRGRPMKKELEAAAQTLKAANDAFLSGPVKAGILRLAQQLPGRLNALKRRRGAIDFDDILILARRLLAANPQVRRKEIERRRLILIDEFQDTNRLQANLLAYLLLDPEDARVFPEDHELWENLPWADIRPRLFVFGDLKQSIYRFRGAEVEVMAALREALSDGCGAVLALDYNYRSQGPLIHFFNTLFQEHLGAAAFTEHDWQNPVRPALYAGPHAVLLIPGGERPALAAERAAAQAGALKQYLADLFSGARGVLVDDGHGGGRLPAPGDVAVLFRQSRRAVIFKETLKISWKCQTAFGDNPFSYAEVKALLAAFKYLSGLDEEISLAGVLRSPLGPVSDAALLTLARPAGERGARLSEYFSGAREWPENLSPEDLEILGELKELFDSLTPLLGRVPPVKILGKIVEDRHLIPSALLEPDGEERARAVTAFLAASRAAGRGGDQQPLGAAEELAELADSWGASSRGGDEILDDEAIKLMTVHSAKGLEFPIVIVAEADAAPRAFSPPVIISRKGVLAVTFTDDSGRGIKADDYLRLAEEEEARAREEDARLLYVAATRAKDHLLFLGWPKKNKAKPGARVSWFETVAGCEAVSAELATVQYDTATAPPLEISTPRPEAAENEAKAAQWPLELLRPTRPHSHSLPVTALSLLLVSPEDFYNEYHLGLARDFAWRPGSGEDFFQISEPENSPGEAEGRLSAAEVGSLFHAILEKIDLADPRLHASLVQEAELMNLSPSETELESLAKSLGKFLKSPVGQLWHDSRQQGLAEYRELPFRLSIPGPGPGGALTVNGRIDLFHQTPDGGGRIVDYKFTRFRPGPQLLEYEIQLRGYAQALTAAGFDGPLSAVLYFAGDGKPYIHEVDLAKPNPLAPHLERLYELWPLLMATRPRQSTRPGLWPHSLV